jgi:hypothetical protein
MKFFIDNNLSPRIARALSALEGEHGDTVVHLKEKFAQDATDEYWMTELGRESDWIVLTCDKRISKNPHELKAWKESGLVVFFLKSAWLNIQFWEQSWQIIKRWTEIKNIASTASANSAYLVPVKGKIE